MDLGGSSTDGQRLPTGVSGLDTVLGGGLLRGSLYVLCGAPGCGKTVLASQLSFAMAAAAETVLYVAMLSESHTRLLSNLRSLAFFDRAVVGSRVHYISAAATLERGGLGELHGLLSREVRTRGATLLVLDSIGSVADMAPSAVAYRQFLRELATSSALAGCTTLLLAPQRAEDFGIEQYLADGVIELHQEQRGLRRGRELVVTKLRGSLGLPGRHVFEIDARGATVYPRREALALTRELEGPLPRSKEGFGIAGLDDMLQGGVPTGSMTALLGAPGSGKTLLGLHLLAEGLRRGQRALYFGLYETPSRLLAKARGVGLALEEHVQSGALRMRWLQPTEQLLDALALHLLAELDAGGASRVFIDGADGLLQAASHPERFTTFFAALSNELRARGVTAAISVETALRGPQPGIAPLGLSAGVENIVLAHYVQRRSRLHRLVSILKVRESDYDPSLREFHIGARGLEVAPDSQSVEAVLADLPPFDATASASGGATP